MNIGSSALHAREHLQLHFSGYDVDDEEVSIFQIQGAKVEALPPSSIMLHQLHANTGKVTESVKSLFDALEKPETLLRERITDSNYDDALIKLDFVERLNHIAKVLRGEVEESGPLLEPEEEMIIEANNNLYSIQGSAITELPSSPTIQKQIHKSTVKQLFDNGVEFFAQHPTLAKSLSSLAYLGGALIYFTPAALTGAATIPTIPLGITVSLAFLFIGSLYRSGMSLQQSVQERMKKEEMEILQKEDPQKIKAAVAERLSLICNTLLEEAEALTNNQAEMA